MSDNKDSVILEVNNGKKVEIELYPDIAPETVKNFEKLVNDGFYDGLIFHRVIPGFMAQPVPRVPRSHRLCGASPDRKNKGSRRHPRPRPDPCRRARRWPSALVRIPSRQKESQTRRPCMKSGSAYRRGSM